MTKEQFFRWNVITNLCIALSVNTAATLLAGGDTISGWIIGCCMAFAINTVEAIIIPAGRIAKWFAEDICKSQFNGELLSYFKSEIQKRGIPYANTPRRRNS